MMEQKKLYLISISGTSDPLLVGAGDTALICDDETIANMTLKLYAQKYPEYSLHVVPILYPAMFFRGMTAARVEKFLLNGSGMVLSASDFDIPEPEEAPKPKRKPARQKPTRPKKEQLSEEEKWKKKWEAKSVRQRRASYHSKRIPFGAIVLVGIIVFCLVSAFVAREEKPEVSAPVSKPYEPVDVEAVNEFLKEIKEKYGHGVTAPSGENGESAPDPVIPNKPPFDPYEREVSRCTTDVPYQKGLVSGTFYCSPFVHLCALLPSGYSWMTEDEIASILQNDTHQLDWEVAVKGKLGTSRVSGLFMVPIDPNSDFRTCIDVLKTINKDYLLDENSLGGTVWFTNFGLEDPHFKKLRRYHSVRFNGPAQETREIAFHVLNDRLVCVFEQWKKDEPEEPLLDFLEVRDF